MKDISKQLSMHINKQLREKSNFGNDDEKEIKFIDGNILNERKRLDIALYEYKHLQYRLSKEGNYDGNNNLKKKIKNIKVQ